MAIRKGQYFQKKKKLKTYGIADFLVLLFPVDILESKAGFATLFKSESDFVAALTPGGIRGDANLMAIACATCYQ